MKSEITRLSSKGQIVIPWSIREKIGAEEGECFSISEKEGLIVLKKVECELEEDNLRTLEEIKSAWKEIADGKFKKMSGDEFLKEIKKW